MKRKYRKRKFPKYFFIVSLALFLFIGVGYSVIYSNLSLQGNVTKKANSWNIIFDNPVFDDDSMTSPEPTITNGTTMTMNVTLSNPGDKYAFTIDLINAGNLPALIKTINMTQLTEEQNNYLRYKVEYEDESKIEENDLLKAGETKKVHILLEYKKLRATDLYPSSNVNLNLNIELNFYLPEETYNTITLTKNSSSKTIEVSNLVQESTLTDFPIEDADKVIACNNGIEPTTDENNNLVLKKVKQDATCRIETSLANAVTNSGTEESNLTLLNDSEYNGSIIFDTSKNIVLDLNGKNYSVVTETDIGGMQLNSGANLLIKDKKVNGKYISNYRNIDVNSGASLTIINGYYERKNSNSTSGGIISTHGGVLNILGGRFITDRTFAIFLFNCSNQNIIINNATIETAEQFSTLVIYNSSSNNNINVINSTIRNNNSSGSAIYIYPTENNNIFLCKSNLISNKYDISAKDNSTNTKIFYSSDSIFKNSTNIPELSTVISSNNVIQTDIACAE